MYKNHHNIITGQYELTKVKQVHNYNTRYANKQNYYRSFNRLNIGLRKFSTQGSIIWNKIPTQFKYLPLHLFKKKLKQHLINSLNEAIT